MALQVCRGGREWIKYWCWNIRSVDDRVRTIESIGDWGSKLQGLSVVCLRFTWLTMTFYTFGIWKCYWSVWSYMGEILLYEFPLKSLHIIKYYFTLTFFSIGSILLSLIRPFCCSFIRHLKNESSTGECQII